MDILINPWWLHIILKVCVSLVKSYQNPHHYFYHALKYFFIIMAVDSTAFYGHKTSLKCQRTKCNIHHLTSVTELCINFLCTLVFKLNSNWNSSIVKLLLCQGQLFICTI